MRGDIIEVFPTYDENAYRIELFGDEIESLAQIDPLFGAVKQKYSRLPIYPRAITWFSPSARPRPLTRSCQSWTSGSGRVEVREAAWSRHSASMAHHFEL